MEIFNKEAVYDDQISPLVKQIIKICNEHGIPMVASFTFENCPEKGQGRSSTLVNNIPNRNDPLFKIVSDLIKRENHHTITIVKTENTDDSDVV